MKTNSFYMRILAYASLFLCLVLSNKLNAQTSFIQLTDASGFTLPSFELNELENESSRLKSTLPLLAGETFAVYYGSAYSISAYKKGNTIEGIAIEEAIQINSTYYLLILRELDETGKHKGFKITQKLPMHGKLNCISTIGWQGLISSMQKISLELTNNPYDLYPSPRPIINIAYDFIKLYTDCPSCENGSGDNCQRSSFVGIDNLLSTLKFRKISVTIEGDAPSTLGDQDIYDHVKKKINIPNYGTVDIVAQIKSNKEKIDNGVTFTSTIESDVDNTDPNNIDTENQPEQHNFESTPFPGSVYILSNDNFLPGKEWDQMQSNANNFSYVECWVLLKDESNHYWLYSRFTLGGAFEIPDGDGIAVRNNDLIGNRSTTLSPMGIALKFLGNCALDACVQAIANRLLTYNTWEAAFKNVSVATAVWEGVSSFIPWNESKYGDILEILTRSVVYVASKSTTPGYTVTNGMCDFGISVGTQAVFKLLRDYISGQPDNLLRGFTTYVKNSSNATVNKILTWCFGRCTGGGKCFVKGTKVMMSDNNRKAINTIKVGEFVLSNKDIYKSKNTCYKDFCLECKIVEFTNLDGTARISKLLTKEEIESLGIISVGDTTVLILPESDIYDEFKVDNISNYYYTSPNSSISNNQLVSRPVIATYSYLSRDLYDLRLTTNQIIRATKLHPFYSATRKSWVPLFELSHGDSILNANDQYIKVADIVRLDTFESVYNLEIDDTHNYFVGTNDLLVHNWSCGDIEAHVTRFLSNMGAASKRNTLAAIWAAGRNFAGFSYRGNFIEILISRAVLKFAGSGYRQTGWTHPVIDFFRTTTSSAGKTITEVVSMKSTYAVTLNDFLAQSVVNNLKKLNSKKGLQIVDSAGKIINIPGHHIVTPKMIIIVPSGNLASANSWVVTLRTQYPNVTFVINSAEKYLGI